jgi:hypothetical protein
MDFEPPRERHINFPWYEVRLGQAVFLPNEEPPVRRAYLHTSHVIHLVILENVDGKLFYRQGTVCGKMLNEASPRWKGYADEVEYRVLWELPLCSTCRTIWRKAYGPLSINKLLGKRER